MIVEPLASPVAGVLRKKLTSAMQLQFLVDRLRVSVHRMRTELESGGDLLLGVALQEVSQDRLEPGRQPSKLRRGRAGGVVHVRGASVEQMQHRLFTLA